MPRLAELHALNFQPGSVVVSDFSLPWVVDALRKAERVAIVDDSIGIHIDEAIHSHGEDQKRFIVESKQQLIVGGDFFSCLVIADNDTISDIHCDAFRKEEIDKHTIALGGLYGLSDQQFAIL